MDVANRCDVNSPIFASKKTFAKKKRSQFTGVYFRLWVFLQVDDKKESNGWDILVLIIFIYLDSLFLAFQILSSLSGCPIRLDRDTYF